MAGRLSIVIGTSHSLTYNRAHHQIRATKNRIMLSVISVDGTTHTLCLASMTGQGNVDSHFYIVDPCEESE